MEFVGIDKFSLLDYDEKVSVVLFSPACNFRCPFCHNGESVLNSNTPIPFEEIYQFLKSRVGLIDAVVFTGGEPTLMPELIERIREVKSLGFLIKLDTNGTNPTVIEELLNEGLLDYIAMDIKNSRARYGETIGIPGFSTANVEKSVELIMGSGLPYEFRTTLCAELHDETSIREIGEWIKGCRAYFLQAYRDSEEILMPGVYHAPEKETIERFREILLPYIENVTIRGVD